MKKKTNGFEAYVFITQIIFVPAVLAVIGFGIGKKLESDTNLYIWLTVIGMVIGILLDVVFIIQFVKRSDRNERRS